MVKEKVNEIEDYLRENKGKNLSLKKISKNLHMNFRKAIFLVNHSQHIQQVQPICVGSGKRFIHLYCYKE